MKNYFSLFAVLPALLFFLSLSSALKAKEVPKLTSPVMDQANMISNSLERSLDQVLRQANGSGRIQMAILTVESLEDDYLESFSIKVADQWKLGGKESDNGVLLLIAKKERKMRFEIGQGLEGEIPDALAGRWINEMRTDFKAGSFDQGILKATLNVLQKAGFDTNQIAKQQGVRTKKKPNLFIIILNIVIFLFIARRHPFLALFLASGGRSGGGGFRSGGSYGGGFSGGGGGFSGGGASGDW